MNAVFHKTYRNGEPVEIRIYVDSIVIINYPGPPSYISMDKFASGKARPRKYRNRRIGEFFKEIDLSEKAATGTGMPGTGHLSHHWNGSAAALHRPVYKSRLYFQISLPPLSAVSGDLLRIFPQKTY